MRKKIKQVIKKAPGVTELLQLKAYNHTLKLKNEQIGGLQEAVTRLEARNDEWASEVRQLRGDAKTLPIVWPVSPEHVIQATLPVKAQQSSKKPRGERLTINWVLPPMGPVSGGHSDIFRTIQYLEKQGHTCRIYYYDPLLGSSLEEIKQHMQRYPAVRAELFYNEAAILPSDAAFATSWHTAYVVYGIKNTAKKFYYVQDFEPFFDPLGTYSTLAENTYKFGFYGVTLGKWLTKKLSNDYGMKCDYFELGVDTNEYKLTNTKPRKKILFYARPVTPRRGFELGVLALDVFHKQHPEYEINFLGWDITPYEIPFPYVNNGIMSADELNELYNQCDAGLVLSFTNMSLLPLEMIAAGCVPVINDAEHTRMASYASELVYAEPTPQDIADALHKVVSRKNKQKSVTELAESVKKYEWDSSNQQVEKIITRELRR